MELFIIVLILLIFLWRRTMSRDFDYWEKKKVVFEPPTMVIGNMKDLVLRKKTMGEVHEVLYKKYSGERFVGTFRMRDPDLLLMDPEDVKRVLISDFQHFQNRSKIEGNAQNPLTKNLLHLRFEYWKPMRQKVSPAFTTAKLKNMVPLILEVGEEFTKYLNMVHEDGKELEFKDLMARYTTDFIGSCGFGIKMNTIMDEDAHFRTMGRKIFNTDSWRLMKATFRLFSPKLFNFMKFSLHPEEVISFFMNLPKQIIEERIQNGTKRNDFIDQMIELRQKEELTTGYKITDDFIAAQVFLFFVAGFETSSALMSFSLYELALNPEIQDRVYQEISSVLKKHDGSLSYDLIYDMTYLDMVVSETLRKYPPLGTITRICTENYQFPGSELTLEKGATVSIPLLALHYDPKYYPDPEKFIPERFTQEAKQSRHSAVYLPFGEGSRNCVGLRLGKMQSIIGLITVLKDFSVEPCSRTPTKITFDPKSFIIVAKDGIWLKLKKRIKSNE